VSRVVHFAFPFVPEDADERIRAVVPDADVLRVSYLEELGRRMARASMPPEQRRASAPPLTDEQREAFARAEVMVALDVPVGLVELAPNLRWVHVGAAGTEHLSGAGLGGRGVLVTNVRGIAATSMAEFVIGRLIAVWKRFDEIAASQRERQWSPAFGRTFSGSTIGVVGVGAIGTAVARLAKAFGVTVLGVRRSGAPVAEVDEMFRPGDLAAVLPRCDAVVLAAPADESTHHLIDAAALAAMKPGAVLCNVGRGSAVDEIALAEALQRGQLRAAILDVFESEPLPAESPLWSLPGVHVSPHCSVSLDRYGDDVLALFLANLARYVRGETLENLVAPPD
jgi:phosphoglycerate dehydrogenase-like enzyme